MKVSNLKTKLLTKKFIALALAGAFALGGFALTNLPESIANAAAKSAQNFDCPTMHPRFGGDQQITNKEMAKNMEECFGISQQSILDYHNQGWQMHDLHRAASIAKLSGKQIGDILNVKTTTNTWRDVADSFGVTKEQMNEFRQQLMSERIAKSTGMNKSILNQLVKEGYRPHDIVMANALAEKSGKDIKSVLSMKQINNHWKDIASQLGIDDNGYQECREQIKNCFDGDRPFDKHGNFHQGGRKDGHGPHNRMN
ncbi:hypothetical protein [Anaerosinus sp.]|uniref:hypothetical protein n=1 Tax=Selenobaculum sp. TaxID=3074374 RepID=UPI0015AABB73